MSEERSEYRAGASADGAASDATPDAGEPDAEGAAEPSFESHFGRLESVVADLERGDLSLDDSMARYEEGVGLLKACYRQLEDAEARIQILLEGEDGRLRAKEFDFRPTHRSGEARPRDEHRDEPRDERDERDDESRR